MKGKEPVVDLTSEPKDRLTSLPPELIHLICDYLFPEHYPDIAFHPNHSNYHTARPHILENLAATCHTLHSTINTWALHFLRQHSQITKYRDLANPKKQEIRNFFRAPSNHHSRRSSSSSTSKPSNPSNPKPPLSLLPWKDRHCIFCGKPTQRHAIFISSFRCCSACDKKEWPEKITKTRAKTEYYLSDHHLFPKSPPSLTAYPSARDPLKSVKGRSKKDSQLSPPTRPIRYGSYISSNVATTMFLERDVRRLAEEVHGTGVGGWEGYKERRAAAAEERRRKKRVAGRGGEGEGGGGGGGGSREDAIQIL
ncbi:hypothetical protein KC332_g17055 [Hortaea werneckii]|uniref:Uncharacterized protein n=1 Tax=Hortaea werneckii TaxID=91943 RepID=A0A3M7IM96_HORWE|nr:hypothetical protein KC350_g17607 [Hortaea werneckii]KAI6800887.1 hypothetical protein KC358_g15576 [Hortaea werneckii]KAI6903844.1 hypothetical protein KC348_g15520 [Hortaea werneckii]KAI6922456.1 hypothetical protein KC341_g15390 [Hortaea werneckii]KAI6953071.1 hypothetical protein KC321_g17185 [Hortaea werneckii]